MYSLNVGYEIVRAIKSGRQKEITHKATSRWMTVYMRDLRNIGFYSSTTSEGVNVLVHSIQLVHTHKEMFIKLNFCII